MAVVLRLWFGLPFLMSLLCRRTFYGKSYLRQLLWTNSAQNIVFFLMQKDKEIDYLVKVRCVWGRKSAGWPERDTWTRLPRLYLGNKESRHAKVISQLWGFTVEHVISTHYLQYGIFAHIDKSNCEGSMEMQTQARVGNWDLQSLHAHCANL